MAWALAGATAAFAAEGPGDAGVLSLEDAIARALEHNRELVRGALAVQDARLAADQARIAARGVQIVPEGAGTTGSGGEDWRAGLRAEATGSYGTRVGAGFAAEQIAVEEDADDWRRGEVRVSVTQPLFRNFGPLVQNEPVVAAGENLLAARRVWERDRSALVVRVVELYEELILLRRQLASDEAFATRMAGLWRLADARERQGKASRAEVLRMDLQRGEAAARIEIERARLEIQFQEFADLLGLPLDSSFRLESPPLLDLEVTDTERALAVALAERPDYAQALQDIETRNRQERIARRGLLPDLRLTGGHATFGEGPEWSDARRLDQTDWFVGLAAGMNLDLREANMAVARAGLDAEASRQVAEIVRQRLAVEVNSALATYRRTRVGLDLAARNRELAASRAELSRALFDAESEIVQSQLGELAARRDASVASYRLLHVLGTLVPAPREILRHEKT
jgi:outer membrane protein TolC